MSVCAGERRTKGGGPFTHFFMRTHSHTAPVTNSLSEEKKKFSHEEKVSEAVFGWSKNY